MEVLTKSIKDFKPSNGEERKEGDIKFMKA